MGIAEDDRIRDKNRQHQEAFDLYEGLVAMGYDNNYVVRYARLALENTVDSYRNEVLNAMLDIARSLSDVESSTNT